MDMVLELPPTVGSRCGACIDGIAPPFEFSMAFQPVIDLDAGRVYAYEALVRGPAGEPAGSVLDRVTPANRYAFDQSCRVKAIALASRLGLQRTGASLSINFIPGAMYRPENCVRATLAAAQRHEGAAVGRVLPRARADSGQGRPLAGRLRRHGDTVTRRATSSPARTGRRFALDPPRLERVPRHPGCRS